MQSVFLSTLLVWATIFPACIHGKTPAAHRKRISHTKKILKVDSSRLVTIRDTISLGVIETSANHIEQLSAKSKKPLFIFLNSPGGSVMAGSSVIDAVLLAQKRDVKVVCFSSVIAASMAFNIMAYCNERYALANTKLLFHPVSLSGRGMRLAELLVSVESMVTEERKMMHYLRSTLGLSWKDFHRHYFAETMWTGQGLNDYAPNFIQIVDDIKGVSGLFIWTSPRGLFGLRGKKQVKSKDYNEAERVTKHVIKKMGL
jgi:ATP-dependent protease ClpP protease subunit